MVDALVIGGGLVGVSTAYHLVSAGVETMLVDRGDPGRATNAGAGILSAETAGLGNDAWFRFALKAVGYYPALVERLQGESAGDTGYAVCGILTVAVDDEEAGALQWMQRGLENRQQQHGIPAPDDFYEVSPGDALELFPPLARVKGALYDRNAARVDGRLLSAALRRAAEARGLTVKQASAGPLQLAENTATAVIVDGESIPAGKVVIAGGAWSPAFEEQLGVRIPIQTQRGQIIHLNLHDTDTSQWPIVQAFHGHYMVPWADSRVAAGATHEVGVGFKAHVTAGGVLEVLAEALRVAPGLDDAEIKEIRVGLRPVTPDGLPIIDSVPGYDNIFVAAGHGSTGLQLGPFSGKLAADWVLGQPPEVDLTPFRFARFG